MNYNADEKGYYGEFGGAYIPEMLYPNVEELRQNYLKLLNKKVIKISLSEDGQDIMKMFFVQTKNISIKVNIFQKR